MHNLKKTAALPAVETMADQGYRDPASVHHRATERETMRRIHLHTPPREWRVEALERLLSNLSTNQE